MRYPPQTPSAVREAIDLYVRQRRTVFCWSAVLAGLGVAGSVLIAFMLFDRSWELTRDVRVLGPRLVGVSVAVTVLLVLCALLRRWRPFSVAVRLDQALPENLDRWATSLDLATRIERGEYVGAPQCVERLFVDADARTSPQAARSQVSRRALVCAKCYAGAVLVGLLLLHSSNFFNLPLLWRRFWAPDRNLPRDSTIVATVVEANGETLRGGSETIPAIAEGETFHLIIALHRKAPGFSLLGEPKLVPLDSSAQTGRVQPTLEIADSRGTRIAEAVRSGGTWAYTQHSLTTRQAVRIRAGDALTRWMRQEIRPRIRMSSVVHSVRYPGYTRLPDVRRAPLPEGRLSLLEGSRVLIDVECNERYESLNATFEVLADRSQGEPGGSSRAEAWLAQDHDRADLNGTAERGEAPAPQSRSLKARRRKDHVAQLRLQVEQTGILRMYAVGANGLASLERVCVVEAVRDSPPRVNVSGLEPDTYIVPGELVAYNYRVEDDIAVADIIVEWDVAGGARSGNLYGEEYIDSAQFGKKIVNGREMIQRMNYYVYGTSPFRFRLIAIDSKGQEAFTERFRIHIVNNDVISRFEDGMAYLDRLARTCRTYTGGLRALDNQLKIIAKVAGNRATWPKDQGQLLEEYEKRLRPSCTRGNTARDS